MTLPSDTVPGARPSEDGHVFTARPCGMLLLSIQLLLQVANHMARWKKPV